MKTTAIVSIVLAAHVVVLGLVFLVEGCKTHKPEARKEAAAPVLPLPKAIPPPPPVPVREVVLPPVKPPAPETTTHAVQKGETLSLIAAKYKVSVSEILALNAIADPNRLRQGQRLVVPGKGRGEPPKPAASANPTYAVKDGDTLSRIAVRHGTTVKAIRDLNRLTGDRVVVGQKLVLPAGILPAPQAVPPAREIPVAQPPPPSAPLQTVQPPRAGPPKPPLPMVEPPRKEAASTKEGATESPVLRVHVVRTGEEIMDIALTYYVRAAKIREINGLAEDAKLVPGQRLKIPMPE